jgi:hypothetical protein
MKKRHCIKSLLLLFSLVICSKVVFAQSGYKKLFVTVSVPIIYNTYDYSFNDGKEYDNSAEGQKKYITISTVFNNAKFKDNGFTGVFVSEEWFSYKQLITVSGKLSDDKKTIESLTVRSIYTFPADYEFEWYSTEDIEIFFQISNIPFQYGSYALNHPDVKVDKVEYSLKNFEQRAYNRHEKYEEIFIRPNISKDTRLIGSVMIQDLNIEPVEPVNMSITHDGDPRSKDIAALLQDMIYELMKSDEVQLYERGEYFEQLLQEALIGTSDLVDPDSQIRIESVMENYFKEMDIAVKIYTEDMESDVKQWKYIVKIITENNASELLFTVRENTQTSTFISAVAVPVIQLVRNIQATK